MNQRCVWLAVAMGFSRPRKIPSDSPELRDPDDDSNSAEMLQWGSNSKNCLFAWITLNNQVVVSNILYFHPYLGKISSLTDIFQTGWTHQIDNLSLQKRSSPNIKGNFSKCRVPFSLNTRHRNIHLYKMIYKLRCVNSPKIPREGFRLNLRWNFRR